MVRRPWLDGEQWTQVRSGVPGRVGGGVPADDGRDVGVASAAGCIRSEDLQPLLRSARPIRSDLARDAAGLLGLAGLWCWWVGRNPGEISSAATPVGAAPPPWRRHEGSSFSPPLLLLSPGVKIPNFVGRRRRHGRRDLAGGAALGDMGVCGFCCPVVGGWAAAMLWCSRRRSWWVWLFILCSLLAPACAVRWCDAPDPGREGKGSPLLVTATRRAPRAEASSCGSLLASSTLVPALRDFAVSSSTPEVCSFLLLCSEPVFFSDGAINVVLLRHGWCSEPLVMPCSSVPPQALCEHVHRPTVRRPSIQGEGAGVPFGGGLGCSLI